MDVALVNALGLDEAVAGLKGIHTANGYHFKVPYGFAQMIMAAELGFHSNLHDESKELLPFTPVRRAEAAYALWQALNAGRGWRMWSMQRYQDVTLPTMRAEQGRAVQFALQYAGYPYVYAGEWYRPTPAGYCCGAQPQGGFDCSGFVWWVLHSSGPGFINAALRGYQGWWFSDRSSMYLARNAPRRLSAVQLAPMDIVLWDTDGPRSDDWNAASHAGLYLGNGWMIHSSGHRGGVSISWMGDGYWADHLAWGRRVIPGPDPVPPPPPPTPTPTPSGTPTPTVSPTPDATPAP
jgi:cell wall-associated NlpC family hydrolase